ncbi:MAG: hypothetical protein AVDCRST_MAG73-2933, partial [uncultured Thermomicrobiales bacterium]
DRARTGGRADAGVPSRQSSSTYTLGPNGAGAGPDAARGSATPDRRRLGRPV